MRKVAFRLLHDYVVFFFVVFDLVYVSFAGE